MEATLEYYTTELKRFKTTSSKKAFLTRSIKDDESYLYDLEKSYNGSGWLHGERVSRREIRNITIEIELLKSLYKKV